MQRRLLILGFAVTACTAQPLFNGGMQVTLTWDDDVTAACFKLRANEAESNPMIRGSQKLLNVGVIQGDLPNTITLQAIGYRDVACEIESGERSPTVDSTFRLGLSSAAVHIKGKGKPDGGVDAGSDAGVDAGIDAGPPDAGELDAGPPDSGAPDAGDDDAGVDAGSDAGVDAGPPDAGPAEICNNGMDDDGDLLVDCADFIDCNTGATCTDGDLCTTSDRCSSGRACVGGAVMCMGPIAACYVPNGCDAGMCVAQAASSGTFCDGGQCDGTGRCAPFCDPASPTLGGCWQFENDLVDGSGHGADGVSATPGNFNPGSRGLGHQGGVSVGDHASLDCTTALTAEAWVRVRSWPDAGARYGIIDNNGQYGMFIGPGGALRCSAGIGAPGAGVLSLNAWHHVACTFDRATLRTYIDTAEVGALDAGFLADGGRRLIGSGDDAGLALGQNSPGGDLLDGDLDGVRIWCEVRPPNDFCALFGECG